MPDPGYNWIGVIDADARLTPGTPSDPASDDGRPDAYVYRVEFEIEGDPSTTVIEGLWSTDDFATILVNGQDTGIETIVSGALDSFILDEHFVVGVNSIDFVVENWHNIPEPGYGNPTGLLVQEMAEAESVPEPSTLLLLGAGLGVLALRRRRRVD